MEKRTPHTQLSVVKAHIESGKVRITKTALVTSGQIGCYYDDILEVISRLERKDFYKSMTAYSDGTIWHEVYRPNTKFGNLYLKLIVIDDLLVVSFKEK
jgi:motility quorum-sensing regulator/GCU-specific mRNA interferase toxin